MQRISTQTQVDVRPSPKWITFLVGVMLCGLVVSFFFVSDRFAAYFNVDGWEFLKVQEFSIETELPLTKNRVRDWLPAVVGKNILFVSGDTLVRTLRDKPWVETVTFHKEFPSRIQVVIHTKTPAALYRWNGQLGFLDQKGRWIEKADSKLLKQFDLPLITIDRNLATPSWKLGTAVEALAGLKQILGTRAEISQIALGVFPHVRLFLSHPRWEVVLNIDEWRDAGDRLLKILQTNPKLPRPIRRINLLIPKKAVVS